MLGLYRVGSLNISGGQSFWKEPSKLISIQAGVRTVIYSKQNTTVFLTPNQSCLQKCFVVPETSWGVKKERKVSSQHPPSPATRNLDMLSSWCGRILSRKSKSFRWEKKEIIFIFKHKFLCRNCLKLRGSNITNSGFVEWRARSKSKESLSAYWLVQLLHLFQRLYFLSFSRNEKHLQILRW